MVTVNNRGMVGSSSHQHQQQRSYGISEMASEKVGGASVLSAADMMNNNGSKVGAGYRWNGDAMMLGRRRVGLSNGGSVSDGSSDEEEEEEEAEEDVAEDLSDDGEGLGAEEEEEHEADVMDRGGSSRGRDRDREREREHERVGFDDGGTGTEDEGFDEPGLPDSPSPQPVMRIADGRDLGRGDMRVSKVPVSRERERMRDMSSPDDVRESNHRQRMREVSSPEEDAHEATDDSDGERALPLSRGPERSHVSASEGTREMILSPEKGPRGMVDTTKRKIESVPRNGGEPKKRERGPSTNSSRRRRSTGTGERTRFSSDNKARVTLERAREILAAVKAAMVNDPKQFALRHAESRAVENSSSSEDERPPLQLAPPRVMLHQQVKTEDKLIKKRSRAPKGDKEVPPRRRKPKVEVDFHASEEKSFYRRPQAEGSGHEHAFKLGHFNTSGVELSREGRVTHDGDGEGHYERKEFREEGFEKHIAVVEKKVRKRRKTKDADDSLPMSTGLCPGSSIRNENWEPPPSPFGLIQESLYKDPWKVLLSCMLLNKTAGRQMHKVIWDLFSLCPDAESAINTDTAKIAEKVYSLGLQNKRAKMIQRFSFEYLQGDWTNVTQLHGIGKYAADAYAIFCQGLWRDVEPDDHQLAKYWKWLWETDGQGNGFTPDNS
ncbi:methyl-CpG-binding domain protein 4 [Marchantia polymorpha subsp. ruderalis]